jgi:mRNA-degrading endonuclease RelE of RelBE toxin-antitoxin system
MVHRIEFSEAAGDQLKAFPARQRVLVIAGIEKHLVHEPFRETRNRKPLRPNPLAPWELRIGAMRVFYDVIEDDPKTVRILAIGHKVGSKLLIEGKEVRL